MELSAKLRRIRKDNNMTQQELADVLCLSRSVIAQYEKGYKVPTITTIDILSNYFKTDIFNEYKNKLKHFFISLKCIYPYLISLLMLLLSSLCLVNNLVKVNNEYGYNIYNDELKVKYSDEIVVVELYHLNNDKQNLFSFNIEYLITGDIIKTMKFYIDLQCKQFEKSNYYLMFIDIDCNSNDRHLNNNLVINHSPFIYSLKDYNPSLPYDKQKGECRKILNYYIDLIEKIK